MHNLTDRQQAALMIAVADAKDTNEAEREHIRPKHMPAIDALNADAKARRDAAAAKRKAGETDEVDTLDAEAEAIEHEARAYKDDLNCYCDLDRQIRICEAVKSEGVEDAMFDGFEIRARHDLSGSQYVAKSVTEQARATMADLLRDRLDALRVERDAAKARLDARL